MSQKVLQSLSYMQQARIIHPSCFCLDSISGRDPARHLAMLWAAKASEYSGCLVPGAPSCCWVPKPGTLSSPSSAVCWASPHLALSHPFPTSILGQDIKLLADHRLCTSRVAAGRVGFSKAECLFCEIFQQPQYVLSSQTIL